jgi:hypothetical protein
MNKLYPATLVNRLAIALAVFTLLAAVPAMAQWSAEPGASVRNAFGPEAGNKANQCRGACGAGCPDSCAATVTYECQDAWRLSRAVNYDCGTHQGCRVHDDCLDACLQNGGGSDCATQCDTDVMQQFGFESATSWLMGGGPYDGRISYAYTRDAPGALEPAYRCPGGASRQCAGTVGCQAKDGTWVDPVFDSYPAAGADAMLITSFRSGPLCNDRVCEQLTDIRVTGADSCSGGGCTRYGFEFDYLNADPSAPLDCTMSTSGGKKDFIGDLLKQGGDAMTSRNAGAAESQTGNGEDGMAELLGMFGKVLASGDSPEDVNISMTPYGEDGKPIESQRIGSTPRDAPPPVPHSVNLPAASGHLFVPMYQMVGSLNAGEVKERRIRCTHKGVPVVETLFRLHSG